MLLQIYNWGFCDPHSTRKANYSVQQFLLKVLSAKEIDLENNRAFINLTLNDASYLFILEWLLSFILSFDCELWSAVFQYELHHYYFHI